MSDTNRKYKYVLTKVDKEAKYLVMATCNYCPYLINDYKHGEAKCGKFYNNKAAWKDKNFIRKVYGYIQKKIGGDNMNILTRIEIPYWCKLPTHFAHIPSNSPVFYIKDGTLRVELAPQPSISGLLRVAPNIIKIISDTEIDWSKEDGETLVTKPKSQKIVRYTPPITKSEPKVETKICSCCGEDKEKVDRVSNNGMCPSCYEEHKDNKETFYLSFINNFRLKRNKTWKSEFKEKIHGK